LKVRTPECASEPAASPTGKWLDGEALDGLSLLENGENFGRIMGYRELWTLEAILRESQRVT
jgi:hypothetical protein